VSTASGVSIDYGTADPPVFNSLYIIADFPEVLDSAVVC
jgi:hypothetical protein